YWLRRRERVKRPAFRRCSCGRACSHRSTRGSSCCSRAGSRRGPRRPGSPTSRLRIQTEGILNRQLLADPFLETIGAVVLDEFHERSLHSDLALALLREIRRDVRPDLIIVVMSATLDAEPVAHFLDDCPVVRVEGRTFPVDLSYHPSVRPASPEAIEPLVREVLANRS